MPIIKSAKKRARQEVVRRNRNAITKRSLRESIRSFDAALATGKKADIAKELKNVQSVLDTTVKKNLIHKNKASRKLSRLNTRAKAASTASKPAAKAAATKKPAAKKPAAKKPAVKTTKKPAAKKS